MRPGVQTDNFVRAMTKFVDETYQAMGAETKIGFNASKWVTQIILTRPMGLTKKSAKMSKAIFGRLFFGIVLNVSKLTKKAGC